MTTVLAVAVGVLPVFLFLGALVLIDSYKLVALRAILLSVGAGVVAGVASYGVNVLLRPALDLDFTSYSRYVAPVVEETLKATFVVYLLRQHKVGFVVDAAIHGFGIGTGFAFLENLYYLNLNPDATVWTWIVRGVGTAIMHGGATAVVAMVGRTLHNRLDGFRLYLLLPGLVGAVERVPRGRVGVPGGELGADLGGASGGDPAALDPELHSRPSSWSDHQSAGGA